ncbi:MAG: hypothetical protein MUF78_06330 [Candidatus Edwardsbacteria bacterium]|jgi:hypothetical protein|nr:hypothetical protein [Candidatus Edwardsbacteria bacterium]
MSLQQWAADGWLKAHRTSSQEVGNLLAIVRRDLADAGQKAVSADWRFGMAYNAALKLCTILLYAEGYRPAQNLAHYRTLQALPLILGKEHEEDAKYLDTCRAKRNTAEYDCVGGATDADAEELIEFVIGLERIARQWLKARHPKLLPDQRTAAGEKKR